MIANHEFPTTGGESIAVTMSVGLSTLRENQTLDQLIDCADKALYQSKHGGRNMVSLEIR